MVVYKVQQVAGSKVSLFSNPKSISVDSPLKPARDKKLRQSDI